DTLMLQGNYSAVYVARDTDLRHCGIRTDGVRFPDHPRVAGGERRRILDLEAKERIRVPMRPLLEHAAQLHPAAIALVVVAVVVAVPEHGDAVREVAADPAVFRCRRALGTHGQCRPAPCCARFAATRELAALEAVLDPAAQQRLDRAHRWRQDAGADTERQA